MTTARNSRILRIIPLMIIVMLFCQFVYGKIIYVDDDAIGANDGTSWADAYVYLQDALADANYLEKPVDIMVAQGVYKPDQGANQTPGDREASFRLINGGVTLKGGFAGYVEPDPNANDRDRYKTVLSGDLNGDDPQIQKRWRIIGNVMLLAEDAAKRVLVPTGPVGDDWISNQVFDDSLWLSGTGGVGYERSMGYEWSIGLDVTADMYAQNSTCYIRIPFTVDANDLSDCHFLTLNIRYDDAFIAYINGIEVARRNFIGTPSWNSQADEPHADPSAVVFEPIDIFDQIGTLQEGENLLAIHGMNVFATSADFLISAELLAEQSKEYEEYIEENEVDAQRLLTYPQRNENSYHVLVGSGTDPTAILDGFTICGGNANKLADWPSLTRCGGGMCNSSGSPTLTNCIFRANSADWGGGMFNCGDEDICNPSLTNCTFIGNSARKGGGMFNDATDAECSPRLITCVVSQNWAYAGGGIYNKAWEAACEPMLTNCIFVGNEAEGGGGAIFNEADEGYPRPTLIQCVFSGNSATTGGVMECYGDAWRCIPTLENCTLFGNSAVNGNAFAFDSYRQSKRSTVKLANCIIWDGGNEIWNNDGSTIMITYSNIQGGFPGEGNIDVEPLFAVPGYWTDVNDPNIFVEPNDQNAVWIDGDYHLKSEAGRWDPVSESWVIDDVNSPCIDAGDPNSPVAFEPFPNGGIVNMGAYGGTAEASKSPSDLHAKYGYGGGTGEPNDPYLITTAEDLMLLGDNPEDYDKHFILTADIDLDPILPGRKIFDRAVIAPRSFQRAHFTGVFDGNGHKITNLTIDDTGAGNDYLGLFGYIGYGEVRNLGLEGGSVSGDERVGGLVGDNSGTLSNCYFTGSVTGNDHVGGLVGANYLGIVSDCVSSADVIGQGDVGGLVGHNSIGTLSNCCSTGLVAAGDFAANIGGLVGFNWDGIVLNCYSTGDVTGIDWNGGGLVGRNWGDVSNCYCTGSVTGGNYSEDIGGLVGENLGDVLNCYCTGLVTTGKRSEDVGGLVGGNEQDGSITSSFWDTETSGQTISAGGTGKTTAEMQTASTFLDAGWDFVDETANGTEDIWWILEGRDYSRLWWEAAEQ